MKRNGYIIFTYIDIAWIMMKSKGSEDHDAKTYSKVCVCVTVGDGCLGIWQMTATRKKRRCYNWMMEGFKAMFYVKVEVESRFWFETELRNKETSLIFILFSCT